MPSRVTVFGRLYDQTLGATFFGVVNNLPPNIDAGGRTLDQALCEALMVSPWILATFGDTTVAIFRHDNCLFVFDSHARNTFGFPDADGASILMSFHSQGSLAEYLQQMYSLRIFNISPLFMQPSTFSNGSIPTIRDIHMHVHWKQSVKRYQSVTVIKKNFAHNLAIYCRMRHHLTYVFRIISLLMKKGLKY